MALIVSFVAAVFSYLSLEPSESQRLLLLVIM